MSSQLYKKVVCLCHQSTHYSLSIRCFGAKFIPPKKSKGKYERESYFVDFIKVQVLGGKGGDGLCSFTSLPKNEWAGPDGGNGGNGGHVLFKAYPEIKSLNKVHKKLVGNSGVKGGKRMRDGKNAAHKIIEVPMGTVIKSEEGQTLASLDEAEAMFIAARGGSGGKGNYYFLSNENRAPTECEKGALGQERTLCVELKTMAHAGLIGFPNAGKSTLLRAISRAQPKVSPYPFTTLNPHLGMLLFDDHVQIAVADIPGLIPGAHQNRGLGHSFLRHIERCLALIYVLDLSVTDPWGQLQQLRFELNQYQEGLADRPNIILGNKIDTEGAVDKLKTISNRLRDCGSDVLELEDNSNIESIRRSMINSSSSSVNVLGISAKHRIGMEPLIQQIRLIYDSNSEGSSYYNELLYKQFEKDRFGTRH